MERINDMLNEWMAEKLYQIQVQQEQLKAVAKAVEGLGIPQPERCLFGWGSCCYPISACYECPAHAWNKEQVSLQGLRRK